MKETNDEHSHKTILKATGIFGFTQVFKVLIGLVSSKLVAVLLGPVGVGVVGLLNNALSMITSLTSFGFNITGVRAIALAESEHKPEKTAETILLLNRWSLVIGLFGALLSSIFSYSLSQWTFGTPKYYYWFIILSINFVLTSYTASKFAVLQGMRMLKAIALSSVVSSLFITMVTIPLYYFLGFEGILPVIITSSAVSLLVNMYYTRKISTQKVTMSLSETFQKGKPLMRLGFLLSINIIFGQICTYLIKLYLNGSGTSSQILGFYEVSTVILVSYLGMIFNAMGNDFYPRLTSTIDDNVKVKQLVNNQIEVALLLVVPAIVALYLGAPLLIDLLYTKEFVGVLPILKAGLFSVIIKAVIWPLSFIILSKGDNKQYFKQELFGDFMNIFLTILFYKYWGLLGIGLASVINFSIYGVYVYAVVQRKYAFSFTAECWTYIWKALLVGLSAMLLVFFVDYPYAYYPLAVLLLITLIYSYKKLNQLVDLAFYFNKIKNRFR